MKNNSKFSPRVCEKQPLAKRPSPGLVRSDYVMPGDETNVNFNEEASFSEFTPAGPKPSEYLMDQIKLEKPTKKEIADAIKQDPKSSEEEPLRPVAPSPSEYQLASLNNQLSAVPMVVAFNEKERRKAQG
ncbi:hypothetical protein COOONC_26992 [Cooperia oncophora]